MSISDRLKKLEKRFEYGKVKIYLEDGSVIKKDNKEILEFVVAGIDCNIHDTKPDPGHEFLLKVDENDDRNDKAVILAKRMMQNREAF